MWADHHLETGVTWSDWSEADLADILEIERARSRAHEKRERRDARLMAFLVTLHTGKPCTVEDLIGKPSETDLSEEEKDRRAKVLAAYHSQAVKSSQDQSPRRN